MRETDVVIGGSQADLAGKAQEPDDAKAINRLFGHDAACVRVHKGHPPMTGTCPCGALFRRRKVREMLSAREQRVREELRRPQCPSEEIEEIGKNIRALVRDAVAAERERSRLAYEKLNHGWTAEQAAQINSEEQEQCEEDLRAEIGRLHSLLERANALLPPDDPVNQEIEREFETCTETIDNLCAEVQRANTIIDSLQAQAREAMDVLAPSMPAAGLVDACRQAGRANEALRKDAREMARAIGKALAESRNGTSPTMAGRMVEQLSGLDADLTEYVDGGE